MCATNKLLINIERNPVDTGRKLNVHNTFRRRPGRLVNVLCTLNLRPVSTGKYLNNLMKLAIETEENCSKFNFEGISEDFLHFR